jgi:hypothetical protein
MKSLRQLSKKLWINTQLCSPGWVQTAIIPYLYEAKDLRRARPYLSIHRLQGQNGGNPLTVDYVGLNYWPTLVENLYTDYKPTLVRNLFTEKPTVREIGQVPIWRASSVAARSDTDLVVVIGSKRLIRRLPRHSAVVLPFFVRMVMNVQGDWEDVKQRIHKNIRNSHLRLVRKYSYEYELSHCEEDFELFYHRMYLPTTEKRHGELASPMSFEEAHQNFWHGYLHLVKRNGQYVAGGLYYAHGNIARFRVVGVIDADEQLMREGALGAYYYALVHSANQAGFDGVNFGDCTPLLTDGIFQYKRRWGSTAMYSEVSHEQIWIKIQRDTPAVRQFFKDNPLIIIGEHGQLQGLIVTDETDNVAETTRNEWNKQYATPGLDGLLVCSMRDLFRESAGVGRTG